MRDIRFVGSIEWPLHASSLAHVLYCPWRVASAYLAEDAPDELPQQATLPSLRVELPKALAKEQKSKRQNRLKLKRKKHKR